MKQGFIENNIIILSKQTLDAFLKEENPSDLIGLYVFYYYTAKWQETNIIKCSTGYVAKGLRCRKEKVIKNKKKLILLGLIKDEERRNKKGQITGWYIKINYIWKRETITNNIKTTLPPNQRVAEPEGGNGNTNALSADKLNALSADKKLPEQSSGEEFSIKKEITKLSGSSRKDFKIIAHYLEEKKLKFDNKEQYISYFKRCLKAAKDLKGYNSEQVQKTMKHCQESYDEWGLETVAKRIIHIIQT